MTIADVPRSQLVQAFRSSIATPEAKVASSALWVAVEALHAVGLHQDARTVQDALLLILTRRAYRLRNHKVASDISDIGTALLRLRSCQVIDRPTFRLGGDPIDHRSLEVCRCLCAALAGLGPDITPQPPRSLADALESFTCNAMALAEKVGLRASVAVSR